MTAGTNSIFGIIIVVPAIIVIGIFFIYFLSTSAFGQIPYFPKYSAANAIAGVSSSDDNKTNNSKTSYFWPNTNMPKATEKMIQNNGTPKESSLKNSTSTNVPKFNKVNRFGIKEIYPSKEDGRIWYLNMNNPINDSMFSIGSGQSIIKQNDGSWRITNPLVRMSVNTPPNFKQWKNVEITGYVKVISIKNTNTNIPKDIAWLARGGVHTNNARCNGTALIGGIHLDGSVGWKKEIWFTGGYTDELAQAKAANSLLGRWIGWKVVMYNIDNNTAVKMESYLDNNNNNHWIRVTNLTDNGGWYAHSSDKRFYSAKCGKPKDYIMTNSGPDVIFRSDNMILDFKNLSVREIKAI
jgi:hypothetical protein